MTDYAGRIVNSSRLGLLILCIVICVFLSLVMQNLSYLLSLGTCPHAPFGQYFLLWLMSHETEAQITLDLISLLVFKKTLGQSFYPHTLVIYVSLIPLALLATVFFSAHDVQTTGLSHKEIVHSIETHNSSQCDSCNIFNVFWCLYYSWSS